MSVRGVPGAVAGQDLDLDVRRGVADRQAEHESVELRLGQRVRAFVLDRVLRGDHHERRSQRVGLGVHRDLPFLHALQQRGLRLGAGSVDLVAEHDVGEDGARLELEITALLVEDVHAGDVGGEQVRGELDPAERAVDRSCDGLREHGLADARDVLDQEVPLGHQGDEGQTDLAVLAPDDPLDVRLDLVEACGEPLPILLLSNLQRVPPGSVAILGEILGGAGGQHLTAAPSLRLRANVSAGSTDGNGGKFPERANRTRLPTIRGHRRFPGGDPRRTGGDACPEVKRRAGPAGRRPARPLFATSGISAEPTRRVLGKITRV